MRALVTKYAAAFVTTALIGSVPASACQSATPVQKQMVPTAGIATAKIATTEKKSANQKAERRRNVFWEKVNADLDEWDKQFD